MGSLADTVAHTAHLLAPRGRVLAMKGRVPDAEIRALPKGWRAEVVPLRVPGVDAERHLVILHRNTR